MKKQKTLKQKLTYIRPLAPAFATDSIPIAFSSSDYFVPYLAVTIRSIMEHAGGTDKYDLIVFTKDITLNNQIMLKKMLLSYPNFSIRFVNMSYVFTDLRLYTPGHISIETYFRLIIPSYMSNYPKILFLDSDLCILENIAHLYHIDIGSYAVAAARECLMSALVGIHGPHTAAYLTHRLGLKNIDDYFQAGVMIVNVKEFIKNHYCQQLLKMVNEFNYDIVDQDALNELLQDKIYWLSNEWNYTPLQKHMHAAHYLENMSDSIRKRYLAVENPKILHFADREKPWFFPMETRAEAWWEYARKTPYYEEILRRMAIKNISVSDALYIPSFPGSWIYYKTYVDYVRCKILSHILWGKRRRHYHHKMHAVRARISIWRELRKKLQNL